MPSFLVDENLPRSLAARLRRDGFVGFPPGTHHGFVIVRFPPEISPETINAEIARALLTLSDDDRSGNLAVVEPGRVRVRRR